MLTFKGGAPPYSEDAAETALVSQEYCILHHEAVVIEVPT